MTEREKQLVLDCSVSWKRITELEQKNAELAAALREATAIIQTELGDHYLLVSFYEAAKAALEGK